MNKSYIKDGMLLTDFYIFGGFDIIFTYSYKTLVLKTKSETFHLSIVCRSE